MIRINKINGQRERKGKTTSSTSSLSSGTPASQPRASSLEPLSLGVQVTTLEYLLSFSTPYL